MTIKKFSEYGKHYAVGILQCSKKVAKIKIFKEYNRVEVGILYLSVLKVVIKSEIKR